MKDLSNAILADILSETTTITVAGIKFLIDPSKLQFNDANISNYMETEGAWYNFFCTRFVEAEAEAAHWDSKYDGEYYKKFVEFKEGGCSDKLAEAKAKSDPDVIAAKDHCILSKTKAKLVQQHLRAWDKTHENAQNRNYTLRKEMEKMGTGKYAGDEEDLSNTLDSIIKST